MPDEKSQIVKVEIVAPDRGPRPDAAAVLREIVQREVAKALASRDDFIFQPFLQSKRVSDEIRRIQNVPERQKWRKYFDRWGCVVCGTKTEIYDGGGCGMCRSCHSRIFQRLQQILKKSGRSEECTPPRDDEALARAALLDGSKMLPAAAAEPGPAKARRRRG